MRLILAGLKGLAFGLFLTSIAAILAALLVLEGIFLYENLGCWGLYVIPAEFFIVGFFLMGVNQYY